MLRHSRSCSMTDIFHFGNFQIIIILLWSVVSSNIVKTNNRRFWLSANDKNRLNFFHCPPHPSYPLRIPRNYEKTHPSTPLPLHNNLNKWGGLTVKTFFFVINGKSCSVSQRDGLKHFFFFQSSSFVNLIFCIFFLIGWWWTTLSARNTNVQSVIDVAVLDKKNWKQVEKRKKKRIPKKRDSVWKKRKPTRHPRRRRQTKREKNEWSKVAVGKSAGKKTQKKKRVKARQKRRKEEKKAKLWRTNKKKRAARR